MRLLHGALVAVLALGGCGAHCDAPCPRFSNMSAFQAHSPPRPGGRVLVTTGAWLSAQPGGDLHIQPSHTLVAFVGFGPHLRGKPMQCAQPDAPGGIVLPANRATFVHVRDAGPLGPAEDVLLVPMCGDESTRTSWTVWIAYARWYTWANDPEQGSCVRTYREGPLDLGIEGLP